MARRRAADDAVRIEGLAELRLALKKIDRELDRGLAAVFRQIGRMVRDAARRNAPVRSGALRKSIRSSVSARRSSIYSNLDYAPVHEWGGTIRPNGGAVKIEARRYMNRGVSESRRVIDAGLDGLLDHLARVWADKSA